MFCSNCKQELEDGVNFCSHCGKRLAPTDDNPPKKPSHKKRIIGLCVGAASFIGTMALIVGLVFLFTGVGSNDVNASAESVAANWWKAGETVDVALLLDCVPESRVRQMEAWYGVAEGDRKGLINAIEQNITDEDRNTCEILRAYRDDDPYELAEYTGYLDRGNYDLSYKEQNSITDACIVYLEMKINGEYAKHMVFCIKCGDKWYALDAD